MTTTLPSAEISPGSERYNTKLVQLHQSRIDLGEIWINSEIDSDIIETACMRLLNLYQSGKFKRVVIYINTPGGSVSDGRALTDLMETLPIPVWTVNIGGAFSMGLVILLAGERRFSMPGASFLLHSASYASDGDKAFEHEAMAKFVTGEMKRQSEWIADRTDRSAKWWYDRMKRADFWFHAEEAQKLGVITDIIGPETYEELIYGNLVNSAEETKLLGRLRG